MAITIIQAPDELAFVRNPVAFVLETDNVNTRFIRLSVLVEKAYGQGDYTSVSLQKEIDSDNRATFYIHEIIRANMQFEPPQADELNFTTLSTTVKKYFVAYKELDVVNNELSSVVDNDRFALLAGWDFLQFPDRATLLPGDSKLLTTAPLDRYIKPDQVAFIYALPTAQVTDPILEVDITYKDGFFHGQQTVMNGIFEKYQPLVIPVSYAARDYESFEPTREIDFIQLYCVSANLNFSITLRPFTHNSPYQREWHYANSLGGWDWLITTGKASETLELLHEDVSQRFLDYDYNNVLGEYEQSEPVMQTTHKLATGFKSLAEFNALRDLLQLRQLYQRVGDKMLRVIITNKKVEYKKDGEYLYAFTLEYQLAYHETGIPL